MANSDLHTNLEQLGLLATRAKSAIPTKVSELTNDSGYQTASEVETAIAEKIGSAYKIKGSKAFAELTADLLVAANEGNVYNVSNAFATTASFVEGAGKKHPAGTNVVIVNNGTSQAPDYKFDVLGGDFSGFTELVDGATNGNLAGLDANGQTTDSGVAASDVVTKVASATAGNFAGLDANGNITDSGYRMATNAEVNTLLDSIFGAANAGG